MNRVSLTSSLALTSLALTSLALPGLGCGGQPFAEADLAGSWTSVACETFSQPDGSKTYTKRHFTISETQWQVQGTEYADPACAAGTELMRVRLGGGYRLGAASAAVEGAREGEFDLDDKFVTPLVPAAVDLLQGAGCGKSLAAGTEADVSAAGCLIIPSDAECKTEYDLVKLDGKMLYFGLETTGPRSICKLGDRPKSMGGPVAKD